MSIAPEHALPSASKDAYSWRPLRIFAIYRIILAVGLAVAVGSGSQPASGLPGLLPICLIYVTIALLAFALAHRRRPAFTLQLHVQIAIDILVIALLMHLGGSLGTGLGSLLLVAVAAGSILSSLRSALWFAALANALLSAQLLHGHLTPSGRGDSLLETVLLGTAIFITALAANKLARRARESQALAHRRGVDLANLEALNHHIVQRLDTGVLAVDETDRVRLGNHAAWRMLGIAPTPAQVDLRVIAPELARALSHWRLHQQPAADTSLAGPHGDYRVRLQALDAQRLRALVVLEDAADILARVQQEKLAALGRLTASIAHEIRNPLGAISHAGQLLAEGEALSRDDRRLLEIIRNQSARLNGIVENVLQLSRRRPAKRRLIALEPWLQGFAAGFLSQFGQWRCQMQIEAEPAGLQAEFDPEHLQQVLDNLCGNALQHSGKTPVRIRLRVQRDEYARPQLDCIDNGGGIAPAARRHLFEPFFTTAGSGTGLGLYLCRELCQANQAQLDHLPATDGCRFRIRFGVTQTETARHEPAFGADHR